MKQQQRFAVSDADPLPPEMLAIEHEINKLDPESQGAMQALFLQLVNTLRRRRRVMAMAHEALSQLRLEVKYLTFDLEATREEKRRLQEEREGNWD